jgi:TolB protein
LTIEVTGGVEAAQPIAVVPFGVSEGLIPKEDVAAVIAADLARSGRFRPMPSRDMIALPRTHEEVVLRDWSVLGMNSLVIGRVEQEGTGYRVSFTLYDVFRGEQLASTTLTTTPSGPGPPRSPRPRPPWGSGLRRRRKGPRRWAGRPPRRR